MSRRSRVFGVPAYRPRRRTCPHRLAENLVCDETQSDGILRSGVVELRIPSSRNTVELPWRALNRAQVGTQQLASACRSFVANDGTGFRLWRRTERTVSC